MQQYKFKNGAYLGVVSVSDTGHISIGVECECVTSGPRGHYVAMGPAELERMFRWLCDRVPGLAESVNAEV